MIAPEPPAEGLSVRLKALLPLIMDLLPLGRPEILRERARRGHDLSRIQGWEAASKRLEEPRLKERPMAYEHELMDRAYRIGFYGEGITRIARNLILSRTWILV